MGAIIATGAEWDRGDRMVLRGRVTDCDGRPVADARIGIWQADDIGHYDVQDPRMDKDDLRTLLTTGAGGEAEKSVVELDSVYVLLEGQLVVVTDEGETVLERLDAVHVTAGTVRAVQNRTTLPASMLVIRPNPDA